MSATSYTETEYRDGLLVRAWADGQLVFAADDDTRTVTVYTHGKAGKPRPYTAEENAVADARALEAARLTDLAERVARIEAALFATDEPAPEWPGVVYPGQAYTDTDGTVYRNTGDVPLTKPVSEMSLAKAKLAALWTEEKKKAEGRS